MDLTNLIWSLFSENGTAADAFYRSTNRQTCIITGIEFILMCRRECFHNWIKEDSNLDLTCVQTQTVAFSVLHILLSFKASLGQHSLPSYYRPTYKERSAELLTVVISLFCSALRADNLQTTTSAASADNAQSLLWSRDNGYYQRDQ